ncbi:head maturation protease, ClpP-related [Nevskia sp.]|uniref:head maturation protease, ClpP-related n=1 Tax=Nevskia sp. TaxID=1929292 RepID=UPI0025F54126|nr:head maturation protease, ClpP-related [Nevskia sp.]
MKRLLVRFRALVGEAGTYELRIFGDIGDFGGDQFVTADDVVGQIERAKASRIVVRMASFGGLVSDGLRIYNALVASGAEVVIRIEGMTGSIAGIISMAGDQVLIAPNAQLMIHQSEASPDGNADRLRQIAQGLDNADRTMAEIYAAKTGRTADEELALMKQGERYLTAQQAIAEGYADALLELAPIQARAVRPFASAALHHYLPKAGKQAPLLAAWIKHASTTAATAAIPTSPETRPMKYMNIAKMLGLPLAEGADDAAARMAVLQYLGLAEDADDEAVLEAMAAMIAEMDGADPAAMTDDEKKAAAQAKARATIAAKAAKRSPSPAPAPGVTLTAMQIRQREVGELFDIAVIGRTDRTALNTMRAQAVLGDKPISEIRAELTAYLGSGAKPISTVHVDGGADQLDKRRAAASLWLMARAGAIKPGSKLAEGLNGNPFRGMNLHDLARDCVEEAGAYKRGMARGDVIKAAITYSTSDFPNIFENALNKMLLQGFGMQPFTWNRFCKVGSLTDFRPHIRYRNGSISDLEVRQENGEFKTLLLTDAERETISATTKGGIVNVSYEMLVNDDMSVFTDTAMRLGQAAGRTIEKAVYALFALNSGFGPTMGDGEPLFDASHSNIIATGTRPTVASVRAMRNLIENQLDVSGNDFGDLMMDRALVPVSLYDETLVVNNAQFDPTTGINENTPNTVRSAFNDVIKSPRAAGTVWYGFADPNIEPVIEVGFLDGQQEPELRQEEDFSQHGMKWRATLPFGVAGIGWRGAVRNPGAAPA